MAAFLDTTSRSTSSAPNERATSPTDSMIFAMSPINSSPLRQPPFNFAATSPFASTSKHASSRALPNPNVSAQMHPQNTTSSYAREFRHNIGQRYCGPEQEFMYSMPRFTPHPLLQSTLRSSAKQANLNCSRSKTPMAQRPSGSRSTPSAPKSKQAKEKSSSSMHPYPSPPTSSPSSPM